MLRKAPGFERQGTVTTPDGPAVYMVQTRQAFEPNTRCCLTFHRGGRQGLAPRPPLMSNVKHHGEAVIAQVSTQLSEVVGVIERHLEPTIAGRTFCTAPQWMAA